MNLIATCLSHVVCSLPDRGRGRLGRARTALFAAVAVMLFCQSARAQNTVAVFSTSASDMSVGTNYAPTITPTFATASDIEFSGTYTGSPFTVNGTGLVFGTLNDLDATDALVISNANSTAGSITLTTPANSVSGTTADLLYVASGGNLAIQSGTGTLTLITSASGNFDNAGTLSLAGPISLGAGTITTFTGNGATTVGGSIGASNGAVTINNGSGSVTLSGTNLYSGTTTLTAGTLNINSASAIGAGGFLINGGTINSTATFTSQLLTTNNAVTWGGNFTFTGTNALNFGTGAVTMTGSDTITLGGATLTFGGAVTNTQTTGLTTTVNGAGHTLVLGSLVLSSASTGAINDTFNGTGNVTISGIVSNGTSFANGLVYSGTGVLTLGGASNYTGGTQINSGTLRVAGLATSTVTVLGALANNTTVASGATLDLNGGSIGAYTGTISIAGTGVGGVGAITNSSATGLVAPQGVENITLTNNASIGGTGRFDINGVVTGGGFTLTKIGADYIAMKGTTTNLPALAINAGDWEASTATGLGSGSVTVAAGGVVTFFNAPAAAYTNTWTLSGGEVGVASGGAVTLGGTGITLSPSTTSDFGGTVNGVTNNLSLIVTAPIGGSGNLQAGAGGAGGFITLSGTNNYSGTTAVTAGTLEFTAPAALYNGTTASWTAGNLIVSPGATLAFGVGTSQFNAANIQALAALGTATGGFENGSILGLDTSAGSFAYGNVIANPNGGANVLGLTKLGANTLTLSSPETYTGPTLINAGILNVTGSLSTSSAVTVNGGTLIDGGTLGKVTLTSGAITPGSGGSVGTLTTGALSIAAGSSLNYILGSPGNGSLISATGLTLPTSGTAITVNLTDNAGAGSFGSMGANGLYPLIYFTSLTGGNATFTNTFKAGTTPASISGHSIGFVNVGSSTAAGQVELGVTQSPLIYQDTFNRGSGAALNASAPTIENGNSNLWSATTWTTATTSGGQASISTTQGLGLLSFTPAVNSVYTYSVGLNANAANSNWLALGFGTSALTSAASINNAATLAWMLERGSNSGGNFDQFFFNGSTTAGGNLPSGFPNNAVTGQHTFTIVLATGSSLSSSTVYWLVDGLQATNTTAFNATNIAQIVIGNGGSGGTATNLSFSSGSTWLGPGGATGTNASWSNNTTANATSTAVSAGWSAGVVPNAAGATATFAASIGTTNTTITLDGSRTVGLLTFANSSSSTSGAGNYTIAQGSGGTLTLDDSGNGAVLTNYWGSNTISAPVSMADNVQAVVAAGSTLSLNGGISDTGSHTLSVNPTGTSGTLLLSSTVTVGGGTTVYAGALGGTATLGNVRIAGGGLTPGSSTSIGTLTIANLTLAAGTSLNYVLGSPGNGSLIAATNLALPTAGTPVTVNIIDNAGAGGFGSLGANGVYPLISYSSLCGGNSTIANTFTTGTVSSSVSGRTFGFVNIPASGSAGTVFLDVSQSALLIQDAFNRGSASPLNGSAPTIHSGSSVTWTSAGWTTTASVPAASLAANAGSPSGVISFVPTANNVYTFSANLNPTAGNTDWLAIGFANSSAGTGAINSASTLAWMLERNSGTGQAFSGGATGNATTFATALNGLETNTIVLDTRSGLTNATLTWYLNGVSQKTATGFNASTIANLIIGSNGTVAGTVQGLTLSTGGTWNVPTGGSWNTATNWAGGFMPNATGASATLPPIINGTTANAAQSVTITLDAAQTVGVLTFANTAANSSTGAGSYTVASGTSGTLLFDNGGNGAVLTSYFGNNVVSAPVTLVDNLQAVVGAGSTLNVSGAISDFGSHSLSVNPTGTTGTLILSNTADSYGGGTTIYAGTLQLDDGAGNNGAITGNILDYGTLALANTTSQSFSNTVSGPGGLTKLAAGTLILGGSQSFTGTTRIAGGTLQLASSGALGGGGNVTFTGGTLQFTAANTSDLSTKIVGSTSPILIDINGLSVTFAGALAASNTGGLTLNDSNATPGSLTLSAASNGYSGPTTVAAGTLRLSGSSTNNISSSSNISLAAGSTLNVTGLSGGTLALASGQNVTGVGTVLGTLNASFGSSVSPGANTAGNISGAIGTLTLGTSSNLTLGAGATLNYDLGTPGTGSGVNAGKGDLTSIAGTLTLPSSGMAAVNLFNNANAGGLGSIGNGTYQLFTYGSLGNTFNASQFTVRNSPLRGGTYSFSQTGNEIDLTIAGTTGTAPGVFSATYLTSSATTNLDASIGLNTNKTYLNAVDTGSSTATTINGITFAASTAVAPSGTGTGGTTWALGGTNSGPFTNFNALVAGNLKALLSNFVYGGNPATLTVGGLTSGQTYVITFYNAAFDAGPGSRVLNLTTSDGITTPVSFDEDTAALGGSGGTSPAAVGSPSLHAAYTFVASSPSEDDHAHAAGRRQHDARLRF